MERGCLLGVWSLWWFDVVSGFAEKVHRTLFVGILACNLYQSIDLEEIYIAMYVVWDEYYLNL